MLIGISIIVSYILGSIPFALVVSKIGFNKDIRQLGSGNLGATNTFRALGIKAGIIVITSDILKGTLATLIPIIFQLDIHPIFIGLFAVIGHMFPVFANFRGGKAVATSAGIILAVGPLLFLLVIGIFMMTLYLTKYVSLSSIITSILATILALVIYKDWIFIAIISLLTCFVVYRHKDNIKRIIDKTEPKITWM